MSLWCTRTTYMGFAVRTVDSELSGVEQYTAEEGGLVRAIRGRDGSISTSFLPDSTGRGLEPSAASYDLSWLTSPALSISGGGSHVVRVVDLFAGCGGLSLGVAEACRALGYEMWPVLANDIDARVLSVYGLNFPEAELVDDPIESLLDGSCGDALTENEKILKRRIGEIDLVIGGPPCQGHSDFNNHTRNDDPKNELYLRMARFCEVVGPAHVIIENVPGVERDRHQVAQRTWSRLSDLGYRCDSGIVDASRIGVAQRRKRSVTMASLEVSPSVTQAEAEVSVPTRGVMWAIGDLVSSELDSMFDSSPRPAAVTSDRIDYLFDRGLHDLPDSERPDCHRLKRHSYVSVYGRMHADLPSQTITTGFGAMGRGRYVHPTERRTITPHEAARIQFFPDFFTFGDAGRTLLQKTIGNAVPPKMGYALGLHLLR